MPSGKLIKQGIIEANGTSFWCPPLNRVSKHDAQASGRAMFGNPPKIPEPKSLIPMHDSNRLPLRPRSELALAKAPISIKQAQKRAGEKLGSASGKRLPAPGKHVEKTPGDGRVKRQPLITEVEAEALKLRLLKNPHDQKLRNTVSRLHRLLVEVVGQGRRRAEAPVMPQPPPQQPPPPPGEDDDDGSDGDGKPPPGSSGSGSGSSGSASALIAVLHMASSDAQPQAPCCRLSRLHAWSPANSSVASPAVKTGQKRSSRRKCAPGVPRRRGRRRRRCRSRRRRLGASLRPGSGGQPFERRVSTWQKSPRGCC